MSKKLSIQYLLILKHCKARRDYYLTKRNKISDIQLGMIDAFTEIIDKFNIKKT